MYGAERNEGIYLLNEIGRRCPQTWHYNTISIMSTINLADMRISLQTFTLQLCRARPSSVVWSGSYNTPSKEVKVRGKELLRLYYDWNPVGFCVLSVLAGYRFVFCRFLLDIGLSAVGFWGISIRGIHIPWWKYLCAFILITYFLLINIFLCV